MIDLIMVYYSMVVAKERRKYLGIVLPWGTLVYNFLHMGVCISPDIFQAQLGCLFEDLDYVLVYVDNILLIDHGTF